jgi:hypothetical protein
MTVEQNPIKNAQLKEIVSFEWSLAWHDLQVVVLFFCSLKSSFIEILAWHLSQENEVL